MLRCGLATREAARKQLASVVDLAPYPHQIRRSASLYQNKGSSSKTRIKKTPSRLVSAERETLRDIKELRAKLATQEKTQDAKAVHEKLGELDKDTLDMIYTAINTPDPSTPEELRLEAKRRRRLGSPDDSDALFFETMRGHEIAHRLATLNARMQQLELSPQSNSNVEEEVEKDKVLEVFDRVSFLLGSIGVPKEIPEEENEQNLAPSTPIKSTMGSRSEFAIGRSLFTESSAREELLDKVQTLAKILDNGSKDEPGNASILPLGIATRQEWEALAVCFAIADDMANVQRVLESVEQSGHGSSLIAVTNAASDIFAHRGDVEKCQALVEWMTEKGLSPSDYTHHCLVKAFLRAERVDQALDLISQLEDVQPASLATYTMVLTHLLHRENNAAVMSQVWPLFNRMRLVAHPIPDAPCYAIMISACALGVRQVNESLVKAGLSLASTSTQLDRKLPDTERGLDLFREMTSRYGIRPDVDVYSAVIECCVRRADTYEKAWQFFRNMVELDRHRKESEGEDSPSLAPNRKIFNSLLAGCRRNGDLLRARWILAEMLRSATIRWQELMAKEEEGIDVETWKLYDVEQRRPNDKTMTEIFLTYAKYQPPAGQLNVKVVKSEAGVETSQSEALDLKEDRITQNGQGQGQGVDEETMTYSLPATRQALLREATSLMERIKMDYVQQGGLLSSVKPSEKLISSYCRVLAKHTVSSEMVNELRQALYGTGTGIDGKEEKSLFDILGIQASGWTYSTMLHSLSWRARVDGAANFAQHLWKEWIVMGGDGHLYQTDPVQAKTSGLTQVGISVTWASMIRILANHGQLNEAMTLLRKFAELYPPSMPASQKEVTSPTPSSSLLSLIRGRDIARLQQELPSGPSLEFAQLKALHMKLVESEKHAQDISYIKWLMLSYHPQAKVPEKNTTVSNGQRQVRRLLSERTAATSARGVHGYLSSP